MHQPTSRPVAAEIRETRRCHTQPRLRHAGQLSPRRTPAVIQPGAALQFFRHVLPECIGGADFFRDRDYSAGEVCAPASNQREWGQAIKGKGARRSKGWGRAIKGKGARRSKGWGQAIKGMGPGDQRDGAARLKGKGPDDQRERGRVIDWRREVDRQGCQSHRKCGQPPRDRLVP